MIQIKTEELFCELIDETVEHLHVEINSMREVCGVTLYIKDGPCIKIAGAGNQQLVFEKANR